MEERQEEEEEGVPLLCLEFDCPLRLWKSINSLKCNTRFTYPTLFISDYTTWISDSYALLSAFGS